MMIQGAIFEFLGNPSLFLWTTLAVFLGIFFGALPGLSVTSGLILLLPVIYLLDALPALILVYVMGKSGVFGGCISAISLNIPGGPGSAPTLLDGFPLSQKGFGVKAIQIATLSSVIGDFIGDILLVVLVILFFNLQFAPGPAEIFSIYLCAFVCVLSVMAAKPLQGILSATFGFLLQMIGTKSFSQKQDFTFGIPELAKGIPVIPLMIGMFVLADLILVISRRLEKRSLPYSQKKDGKSDLNLQECKQCLPVIFRSSLIGAVVGILPGVGSTVAAFLAYYECKRRAKNKKLWGKGAIEGVAASEAANNAVSGPSLALLLTLGIPGGSIGIILGSVLIFYNIEFGQDSQRGSNALIYQLFFAGFIGIAIYGFIGFFGAKHLYRFVEAIPKNIFYIIILLSTFFSAYSYRGEIFDVLIMTSMGIITFILKKYEFNRVAFLITFVLSGGLTLSFQNAILNSKVGIFIFLDKPIALIFLTIAFVSFVFVILNFYTENFAIRNKRISPKFDGD